jgi:hypothetical protein
VWKFCNVYRELDRATIWIRKNWREPNARNPDLWFAMLVARFINWPETLEDLKFPVPWNPQRFLDVMEGRRKAQMKLYSGAYMIRADPHNPGRTTATYQEKSIFTPLWENREILRPRPGDSLNSYHMVLGQLFGLGSFMAGQVVADLKYEAPLADADDWWTFAASGPGSRRGLNRVMGRPVRGSWTEDNWRLALSELHKRVQPMIDEHDMPLLHAQDLQNCLCEYDKYCRVLLNEGQPRSRFRPAV